LIKGNLVTEPEDLLVVLSPKKWLEENGTNT